MYETYTGISRVILTCPGCRGFSRWLIQKFLLVDTANGVDTEPELLCAGVEQVVGRSGIGTDTLPKFDGLF